MTHHQLGRLIGQRLVKPGMSTWTPVPLLKHKSNRCPSGTRTSQPHLGVCAALKHVTEAKLQMCKPAQFLARSLLSTCTPLFASSRSCPVAANTLSRGMHNVSCTSVYGSLTLDTNDYKQCLTVSIEPEPFDHKQMDFKPCVTLDDSWEAASDGGNRDDQFLQTDGAEDSDGRFNVSVRLKPECSVPVNNSERKLRIQLPIKYDVSIIAGAKCDLVLKGLESANVSINMGKGRVSLEGLKALNTSVKASEADVLLPNGFVGDLNLMLDRGSFQSEKIQGQSLAVHVGEGDVTVSSLYCPSAVVTADNGTVSLGNCHGSAVITAGSGDVKIRSMDGNLKVIAGEGDIHAFLYQFQQAELESKQGDIHVSVLDSTCAGVKATTKALTVDPGLVSDLDEESAMSSGIAEGTLGLESSSGCQLKLSAPEGNVHLFCTDWMTAQTAGTS